MRWMFEPTDGERERIRMQLERTPGSPGRRVASSLVIRALLAASGSCLLYDRGWTGEPKLLAPNPNVLLRSLARRRYLSWLSRVERRELGREDLRAALSLLARGEELGASIDLFDVSAKTRALERQVDVGLAAGDAAVRARAFVAYFTWCNAKNLVTESGCWAARHIVRTTAQATPGTRRWHKRRYVSIAAELEVALRLLIRGEHETMIRWCDRGSMRLQRQLEARAKL